MINIDAKVYRVGEGSFIDSTAVIRGIDGPADFVSIGDHTYIGAGVQIICDWFEIGDYGKIHHDTNIHGYKPCKIGHNAWIGQFCIIDSIGSTNIGHNCGIGAGSQLWSHIKYGDMLEGNRFCSDKPLIIGNDVWFVGHCIVSPIVAASKSMAMVGSVVASDMKYNSVYAGVPARDITDKVGPQFKEVSTDSKLKLMNEYLIECIGETETIRIVENISDFGNDASYFAVNNREYTKTDSPEEIKFMKFLLPEKAKFVPVTC